MIRRITVLHAVTDPMSTILMRGQMSHLKANGFDPILLSGPGKELEEAAAAEGCPVVTVAMKREISPGNDLRSLVKIWKLLRRIKPIICNSGTPKAGLLTGLAAWLTRTPCRVYTLRGLRLETMTGFKRLLLTATEKVACFTAHRVVCVSESLRERAIELGLVARSKTVLLGYGSSNGVDASRFEPTAERLAAAAELRRGVGIRPEQLIIGFAGRWTKDKGIPELIEAFQIVHKILPETTLLLVGDYENGDPVPKEIRDIIETDPGMYIAGFTHRMDIYYLTMNIFVLPTHREGFPNTILEAQAAELPVVTTRATGAIDAIDDGVTGLLVPVGDAAELATAMMSLLTDPDKRQQMGQLGRARVLEKFRNEQVWESLTSLYKTMLEERGYKLPEMSFAEAERCAQVR